MNGKLSSVYSGIIAVTETGEDLSTGEETLTVTFNARGNEHREVTAPRAELARARGVIDRLGARGAGVHDGNAREVARFIVEFAYQNRDALPHLSHTARLGLVGEGLVTPAGAVGFAADVRYVGDPVGTISTDLEPYRAVLRAALLWEDAWSLWLALGFSLASPAIARIRPRRNPVLYFAGPSNSGKTTITQFSTSAWGDPTKKPLRLEAGRTSRVGYLQRIEGLGGLPLFIDEAHTARRPSELESLAYDFANGQTYTKGSLEGSARGGDVLSGVLILAGEAVPAFRNTGANRRVLWVDAAQWPPLGAEPESAVGQERAAMLEDAWLRGAGALGIHLARAMWGDWAHFQEAVRRLQEHQQLRRVGTWQHPLAVAAAALYVALQQLDLRPPPHFSVLLPMWSEMLAAGQEQTDPAAEAWEKLTLLIAQAQLRIVAKWTIAELHDEPIAYRQHADDYWRVPTGTPQFASRVGPSAAQLYGRTWIRNGWIHPGPDGSATTNKSIYGRGSPKCLMVRIDALARRDDDEEE